MPPRSSGRTAPAPVKTAAPAKPGPLSHPAPPWTRYALAALAALLLFSVFASESADSDTWWHLKTGQYIVQERKLPVPDPFAWTTYSHKEAYPGEEMTRRFNLTHEWLSQAAMYAAYAAGGFAGLISLRAIWLIGFCAIIFLIALRRSGRFYLSLGASLATVMVLRNVVADRPQYFTYVFLALTILILESRKRLWLLPPLFLVWANCHAGFFMGWVVMGAYCGESLIDRLRGRTHPDERRLWTMCLASIAVSGLNPNFFNVIPVLRFYRQSPLQTSIWEWQRPKYWELSPFTILMYGSAVLLLLNWRKSRPVDWILFLIFSVSGLLAIRNIIMIGFWGSILIAAYAPRADQPKRDIWGWAAAIAIGMAAFNFLTYVFATLIVTLMALVCVLLATRRWPIVAVGIAALLFAAGIRYQISTRTGFQFRGAMWRYPESAADFILKHNLKGRIFNTYGQGGYLIWRLWPQQQVFLDGRALNEKVYQDASRITMNAAAANGKSGEELLKEYGIDIILMDGFESIAGSAYYLPAALADPSQKEWKLVYQDIHDVIYMRNPPPDVPVLQSLDALKAMEQQCEFLVEHGQPLCSRGMTDVFGRVGDRQRFDKWRAIYIANRGAEGAFTVVKK